MLVEWIIFFGVVLGMLAVGCLVDWETFEEEILLKVHKDDKNDWKYVETDGWPKKSGMYLCTVIFSHDTDERYAKVELGVFYKEVFGQFRWMFEHNYYKDEHIYAWKSVVPGGISIDQNDIAELPEGVEVLCDG